MAFSQPKKWHSWLSMAMWWYTTSFNKSLKMTHFQALYGFYLPQVAEMFLIEDNVEDAESLKLCCKEDNKQIK